MMKYVFALQCTIFNVLYTLIIKVNFLFQVKELFNRSAEGFTCELLTVINKNKKSFLDKYIKNLTYLAIMVAVSVVN